MQNSRMATHEELMTLKVWLKVIKESKEYNKQYSREFYFELLKEVA